MRVISSRTALLTLTLTLTLGVSGCTVASNASASAGPRALERSTPEKRGHVVGAPYEAPRRNAGARRRRAAVGHH